MVEKYNVGDRVRISEKTNSFGLILFSNQIVTITRKIDDWRYEIEVKFRNQIEKKLADDDDLEDIGEFTISDLSDGMVVEYANGVRRMVMGNKLIGQNAWSDLDYDVYTDNLINNYAPEQSIAKVYTSTSNTLDSYFADENLKLFWERN